MSLYLQGSCFENVDGWILDACPYYKLTKETNSPCELKCINFLKFLSNFLSSKCVKILYYLLKCVFFFYKFS